MTPPARRSVGATAGPVLSEVVPTVSVMPSPSARTARPPRPTYLCGECGWSTPRWAGRCGQCQSWGTLQETAPGARGTGAGGLGRTATGRTWAAGGTVTVARPVTVPARPVGHVAANAVHALSTGVGEVDRVLGGGFVPGAVVLLAGEPGVGKSTLLLDVAARWARHRSPVLYVSGEESAAQVRLRAERIEALDQRLFLAAETELGAVLTHAATVLGEGDRADGGPGGGGMLVLDSVQTVSSADLDGAPGGVAQVREVAGALIALAKQCGHVVVLVGHVTKDGSVAGPRTLEHLVDVVLEVSGDRTSSLRVLRALKNRYGPTEEIGCFDLSDTGVVEVPDPSGLFLSRHHEPVAGTCVTVAAEGARPLVAELQALVAPAPPGAPPRRTSNGLDSGRVAMVLAVLQRRARIPLHLQEVFAATVGGVRLTEPAVDLALALALTSAAADVPLPAGLVAIGEIGLAGELRPVPAVARRIAEAARLGFTHAFVPSGTLNPTGQQATVGKLTVHEFPDVASALAGAGLGTPAARAGRAAAEPGYRVDPRGGRNGRHGRGDRGGSGPDAGGPGGGERAAGRREDPRDEAPEDWSQD